MARSDAAAALREPWLTLARASVLAYAATMLMLFVIALPVRYRALITVCTPVESCEALYLSVLEVAALPAWLGLGGYAVILIAGEVMMVTVGVSVAALIFARSSHTRMGLLTIATVIAVSFTGEVIAALTASVPALKAVTEPLLLGGFILFWLYVLVFPNGRVEPAWARRLFLLPLAFLLFVLTQTQWGLIPERLPLWYALLLLTILFPFALQIVRYRRYATPEQRQQTKWGLIGLASMILGFVLWTTIDPASSPVPNGLPKLIWNLIGWTLSMIAVTLLPVSLTYSILRHRLWDIDGLINRALVYGSLTLILTGIYFGTVVLVQQVVLSGRDAPLLVAGSTLLIAALFAPLRRRIQAFIDTRFYRSKVDGQKALADFAAKARSQVDLDALTTELLRVVGDTIQPRQLSLWLKPDAERTQQDN